MSLSFPVQLTSFVGRQHELAEVTTLLRREDCRLLTLVGPGGAGKTRLAQEAAQQRAGDLPDGAVFVALQPVTSAEFVLHAIASALGINAIDGESAQEALLQILSTRRMLLLLDNFEHVLEAAPLVLRMLERVPALQLLVTSREVLNIPGEQIYEVGGLALEADEDAPSEAMRLFIARATQARHDFEDTREHAHIDAICEQVGGLPLAIELAAAWTRSLSCADILSEIRRSADFLASQHRGIPERHRSLRAVFDQSWLRLDAERQRAFSHLAVFSGAFSREAAATVAGASLQILSALVDQSLLQAAQDGLYSIHSLLRQYAEERLRLNEAEYETVLAAHAVYYLGLVRQLDPLIKSGAQIDALHQIERSLDNIRQAWRYAVQHHRADLIAPAFEALAMYYQMRCRLAEGYDMFAAAADEFAADESLLAGMLLLGRSWFTIFSGAHSDNEALESMRAGMAILARHPLPGLGAMFLWSGKVAHVGREQMLRMLRENEAAYRLRGDDWGLAWTLSKAISDDGTLQTRSRSALEAGIAAALRCGDRWSATWPQAMLGLLAEKEGRLEEAIALYQTRLETCKGVGDKGGVAWTLHQLAEVSLQQGDTERAIQFCRESLRVALQISGGNSVNEAIWRIAEVYRQRGMLARTVELLAALAQPDNLYISQHLIGQIKGDLKAIGAQLPDDTFNAAVEAGRRWEPRQLGDALLGELDALVTNAPRATTTHRAALVESLSDRELEVLRLMANGLTNSEIAEQLVVTVGTIKKHLNNIYGKLGAERRTQALLRAQELGLID